MDARALDPPFTTAEALRAGGSRFLRGWFLASLAGIGLLAWQAPLFTALPLLFPLGIAGLAFLVRRPLLHLCVVIGALVLIFDKAEGIQVSEVAMGLYVAGYLGGWFTYHVLLRRERIVRSSLDVAVATFLLLGVLALVMAPLLGSVMRYALGQWSALILMGLYFPIKEACARDDRALRVLLAAFVFIVLVVAARNFLRYYLALHNAEELWQIMQNRSRANERLLMMGFLGAFVFMLYHARHRVAQVLLFLLTVFMLAGVVVGFSRAVWVATAFGLGVLFLVVDRKQKLRLLLFSGIGVTLLVVVAAVLLDDFFTLVAAGLEQRFTSIGSASSRDISLINRFYEWQEGLDEAMRSPVIGWGFGHTFPYFHRIYHFTEDKYFIHNTYLGVLYRHGFIGLGVFLFILLGTFFQGFRYIRRPGGALEHITALACLAALPALGMAATTEGIMIDAEGVFALTFIVALIAGLWQSREGKSGAPSSPHSSS